MREAADRVRQQSCPSRLGYVPRSIAMSSGHGSDGASVIVDSPRSALRRPRARIRGTPLAGTDSGMRHSASTRRTPSGFGPQSPSQDHRTRRVTNGTAHAASSLLSGQIPCALTIAALPPPAAAQSRVPAHREMVS